MGPMGIVVVVVVVEERTPINKRVIRHKSIKALPGLICGAVSTDLVSQPHLTEGRNVAFIWGSGNGVCVWKEEAG